MKPTNRLKQFLLFAKVMIYDQREKIGTKVITSGDEGVTSGPGLATSESPGSIASMDIKVVRDDIGSSTSITG